MYVYILDTPGGFYTGYTTDLERRWKEHGSKSQKTAKFTRAFAPEALVAAWQLGQLSDQTEDRSAARSKAMKVEAAIKKLSRAEKSQLVANPSGILDFLPESFSDLEICVIAEPFMYGRV